MLVKGIVDEDFINYKLPSMFIATNECTFKCDIENGSPCCQNSPLAAQGSINLPASDIVERYLRNPITKAIVFGGLEPMDQFEDVLDIIRCLRTEHGCLDDVVIYTGYYKKEIEGHLSYLRTYKNIIVKFGRFLPDMERHYDPVLGVKLSSPNQYGEEIS